MILDRDGKKYRPTKMLTCFYGIFDTGTYNEHIKNFSLKRNYIFLNESNLKDIEDEKIGYIQEGKRIILAGSIIEENSVKKVCTFIFKKSLSKEDIQYIPLSNQVKIGSLIAAVPRKYCELIL